MSDAKVHCASAALNRMNESRDDSSLLTRDTSGTSSMHHHTLSTIRSLAISCEESNQSSSRANRLAVSHSIVALHPAARHACCNRDDSHYYVLCDRSCVAARGVLRNESSKQQNFTPSICHSLVHSNGRAHDTCVRRCQSSCCCFCIHTHSSHEASL